MDIIEKLASGLISRLGLGSWQTFAERVDYAEAKGMISRALDAGIQHFDTASDYADGEAERLFGLLLPKHRQLFISTKIVPAETVDALSTTRQIDDALARLQVEQIDLLYCRRPSDDVLLQLPAIFDQLKQDGKIADWGVSRWSLPQLQAVSAFCQQQGYQKPIAVQEAANLFFSDALLPLHHFVRDERMALIGFSPLARGVLAGRYLQGIATDSRLADQRYKKNIVLRPRDHRCVQRLAAIADACAMPLAQLVLDYTFQSLPVDALIAGASNQSQMSQWLPAMQASLPAAAQAEVATALDMWCLEGSVE